MKRLYVLLCFVVVCSGYVKAQKIVLRTGEETDFKTYTEWLSHRLIDSVYRVDTLYYPWEENVQMIELRVKTVRRKKPSLRKDVLYNINIPNIFIFRGQNGVFKNVYNNIIDFDIDSKAFKGIDFVNTKKYKHDYIIVINPHYRINNDFISSNVRDTKKGLINTKGEIILKDQYDEIIINKEEQSIRLLIKYTKTFYNPMYKTISTYKYRFIDYNTFEALNDNIFKDIRPIYRERSEFPYLLAELVSNGDVNSSGQPCLIDNKGNIVIENASLAETWGNMMIIDKKRVLDYNLENILPDIYNIKEVFWSKKGNEKKYDLFLVDIDKQGIINIDNEVLIPLEYDDIKIYDNFISNKLLYEVNKDKKYGIYNENYQLVIPVEYDRINIVSNHIQVKKDNFWNIYTSDYKPFLQAEIDSIQSYAGCFVLYEKNKKSILYGLNTAKLKIKKNLHIEDDIVYKGINKKNNIELDIYRNNKKISSLEIKE